jgi:choline-sulfatase
MADRPNILFICTDQQHAGMLSGAGNGDVRTPALDRLAARGVRFEQTYCTNPVCVPSRFSLFTGRMPSVIGMRGNSAKEAAAPSAAIREAGPGVQLRRAGYRCVYGGKQHLPKTNAEQLGFDVLTEDERDGLAEQCAAFLADPPAEPFFLVASFINPHDICYMGIRDFAEADFESALLRKGTDELAALDEALRRPAGVDEATFFARHAPPLPPNFEPPDDEPEAIRWLIEQRAFRRRCRAEWSDQRWREHRWAYARLTERVDRQIGRVLDALEANPALAERTVVIFTSDHGDLDAAHRLEHKTCFYEEAARVPLIVAQPGRTPAGRVDREHMISNGLDLAPTLGDYAGVDPPADLPGHSFRPLAEGREPGHHRAAAPIENQIGHAVVTPTHKYMLYDFGSSAEQLFDRVRDPHETRNAAHDPDQRAALARHRDLMRQLLPAAPVPSD